jgi:hypothetical protein
MGQRAIRADYDERSLIVYQAYRPEIAEAALRAGDHRRHAARA